MKTVDAQNVAVIMLLMLMQSYYYLDLLGVMCVCNEVARPDNQSYIAQILLRDDPVSNISSTMSLHYLAKPSQLWNKLVTAAYSSNIFHDAVTHNGCTCVF